MLIVSWKIFHLISKVTSQTNNIKCNTKSCQLRLLVLFVKWNACTLQECPHDQQRPYILSRWACFFCCFFFLLQTHCVKNTTKTKIIAIINKSPRLLMSCKSVSVCHRLSHKQTANMHRIYVNWPNFGAISIAMDSFCGETIFPIHKLTGLRR